MDPNDEASVLEATSDHFEAPECPPHPSSVPRGNTLSNLPDPKEVCPFNISAWEALSVDMPNSTLRDYVIEGLHNGFRLRFHRGPLRSAPRNNPSSYAHMEVVDEYINTEIARGSMAGPFTSPPFPDLHVSRFGVIPKSTPGKWRLILDLSFPPGASVNDGISDIDASVSYQNLDRAIDAIISAGRGCLLAKFDICSAYRNIAIHPDDRYLLGMKWRGLFYVDLALSFGGRSAPAIFSSVGDVLQFILSTQTKISVILHYLDDYIVISGGRKVLIPKLPVLANHDFDSILHANSILGVPVADEKTVRPSTILAFLGIVLDTVGFLAYLPKDKVDDLLILLNHWSQRRNGSKRELLSLIGKLSFACQVVVHGRPFLRRLIDRAHSVAPLHFRVHLSLSDREDIRWWLRLLSQWNGVSLFQYCQWVYLEDLVVTTNAAKSQGIGLIFGTQWCSFSWPNDMPSSVHISVLELIPIVIAASLWGPQWQRKRILLRCDNSAVVSCLNSGLPKHPHLAFLVRELSMIAVVHNFSFKAVHVPGVDNRAADALSRFNIPLFRSLMPQANENPSHVAPELIRHLLILPLAPEPNYQS